MFDIQPNKVLIARLSRSIDSDIGNGAILMMVGSYAPAHEGHIAAMTAAKSKIESSGEKVSCFVFVPNSDSYVSFKLHDRRGEWNYERRINILLDINSNSRLPIIVDDITGARPIIDTSITRTAMKTVSHYLGVDESRFVLVVGSDQAASMKPYVTSNRAVCVIRPGALAQVLNLIGEKWFSSATASGRYLFTECEYHHGDISSTQLRRAAAKRK